MKRRRWIGSVLVLCLLATVPCTLSAEDEEKAEAERTRPVTARHISRELLEQAREAVKKDYAWPSTKSDYADKRQVALDSKSVIAELSRSQDRQPAVDAYVKLQLLSFGPALSEIDARKANRLIGAMPKYMPDPALPAMEMAKLQGYNKGQVAPPALAARTKKLQEYLQEQQTIIERANQPTIAYRKALIEALPDEGGTRLLARVQDLADQLQAGRSAKTIKAAIGQVTSDCTRLRTDKSLPAAARAAITRKLQQMVMIKYQTLDSVNVGNDGSMTCKFGKVELGAKVFDELKANLAGRQYVDPKKKK
jgi:hypothetical protein